jgi:hypothetical protein
MSLVTVGELKNYMDITFTPTQEKAALMVLEGLQMEMEAYLRRPVEIMTFREKYVIPEHYFPTSMEARFFETGDDTTGGISATTMLETYIYSVDNSPIKEVTSLKATSPRGTERVLEEGNDFVVRKYGIEFYSGVAANVKIDVIYKGGLDGTEIAYFKLVILRAAVREMQNMHDDTIGIKDLETRNVAPLETGFSESELLRLKRFKRNRI